MVTHHAPFGTGSASAPLPPDVRLMNTASTAVFMLAAATLLAFVLMWLARQPLFTLVGIRVEGPVGRNSVATIRANAAPRLAGNFFTMDLHASRVAFEAVPWVRKAVVRRVWPNRIAVQLEEHRPAAIWAPREDADDANGDASIEKLVNTFGEVFEANLGDVEEDSLPRLSGPEGSSAQMLALRESLNPLFERIDAQIQALSLSGRGSWRATLDTGADIELGRGSHAEVLLRAETFVATLTQVTSRYQRPLLFADLRHRDGYAVRLKGVSTTLTAAEKLPPRQPRQ